MKEILRIEEEYLEEPDEIVLYNCDYFPRDPG